MTLSVPKRRMVLGGALIASIAAAAWDPGIESPPATRVQPRQQLQQGVSSRRHDTLADRPGLRLGNLEQKAARQPVTGAFEPRSWTPPAPVVKAPPPPPPQAPPLPYTYIGKMMDGAEVVVFLVRQERNYVVRS